MNGLKMAGLVLAGGEARRMGGGDKTLLLLHGRPMLAWVIDSLEVSLRAHLAVTAGVSVVKALRVDDIAISANGDPARFATFDRPVLSDGGFSGQGPLAGLLAGLNWAAALGADVLLSAPGDTPFLPPGLATALLPAPCAAVSHGRRHHLVATWPVSCRAALQSRLSSGGPRNVELFANTLGMIYHDFGVQEDDPFANVNTPAELQMARRRAVD